MSLFHVQIKTNTFVTRYDKFVNAENELEAREKALYSFNRWVRNKTTDDTKSNVDDFIATEVQ